MFASFGIALRWSTSSAKEPAPLCKSYPVLHNIEFQPHQLPSFSHNFFVLVDRYYVPSPLTKISSCRSHPSCSLDTPAAKLRDTILELEGLRSRDSSTRSLSLLTVPQRPSTPILLTALNSLRSSSVYSRRRSHLC